MSDPADLEEALCGTCGLSRVSCFHAWTLGLAHPVRLGVATIPAMPNSPHPTLIKADPAASVDDVQAIDRTQADLRSKAASLNVAQIDLLAGEVKVTAEHINAAVAYSDSVIAKIANWRKRICKIGALLIFLAVVPTGRGNEILQAAHALKTALEA